MSKKPDGPGLYWAWKENSECFLVEIVGSVPFLRPLIIADKPCDIFMTANISNWVRIQDDNERFIGGKVPEEKGWYFARIGVETVPGDRTSLIHKYCIVQVTSGEPPFLGGYIYFLNATMETREIHSVAHDITWGKRIEKPKSS